MGSPTTKSVRPSPSSQADGERLQQLELGERGVLELIHQDVAQRESGAQRQLRRRARLGERGPRSAGDVGVIDAAAAANSACSCAAACDSRRESAPIACASSAESCAAGGAL